MDRYDPYFSQDTDGVHFQVCADGQFVQAYVGRAALSKVCGAVRPGPDCLSAYVRHRAEIEAAVVRRVRLEGPETVLVQAADFASGIISPGGSDSPG